MQKIRKLSPTVITALVITLSSTGIIALWLYANNKTDSLRTIKCQIQSLTNSWNKLEKETVNLLVEPVSSSKSSTWQYSLNTFDAKLNGFLKYPLTRKLTLTNRLFAKKIDSINIEWLSLKRKIAKSSI